MKKGEDYIGISVVYMCHDGAGKWLLAKRTEKCRDEWHRWDMGSGGLKFGETLEDGLRRELKEEYDAEPLAFEPLGHREVHRISEEGKQTHWIAFTYKVHLDPAQVKNNEPDMVSEIGWFTLEELPGPLHSQLGMALDTYREQLSS